MNLNIAFGENKKFNVPLKQKEIRTTGWGERRRTGQTSARIRRSSENQAIILSTGLRCGNAANLRESMDYVKSQRE